MTELVSIPLPLMERLVCALEKLTAAPAPTDEKRTMSCEEVALALGEPVSTIRKWAKEGKLTTLPKKGKSYRFDRARIDALVTGEKVELKQRGKR